MTESRKRTIGEVILLGLEYCGVPQDSTFNPEEVAKSYHHHLAEHTKRMAARDLIIKVDYHGLDNLDVQQLALQAPRPPINDMKLMLAPYLVNGEAAVVIVFDRKNHDSLAADGFKALQYSVYSAGDVPEHLHRSGDGFVNNDIPIESYPVDETPTANVRTQPVDGKWWAGMSKQIKVVKDIIDIVDVGFKMWSRAIDWDGEARKAPDFTNLLIFYCVAKYKIVLGELTVDTLWAGQITQFKLPATKIHVLNHFGILPTGNKWLDCYKKINAPAGGVQVE